MRRKYNLDLQNWLKQNAMFFTIKELLPKVNKLFKENFEENDLRKLLIRNRIDYKKEQPRKSCNNVYSLPIGSEYVKPDGMTLVKINKRDWVYKQRKIYEDYYKVKLKDDEFVVFLDQNRNNFNINNLKKISRQASAIMANEDLFSKNEKVTELGIDVANLAIKTKGVQNASKNRRKKRLFHNNLLQSTK